MKRILLVLLLVTAVSTAIFVLSDPVYRYPYWGVKLSRNLNKLAGKDLITVQISLDSGTDLIPAEELSSEPAIQDNFNLLLILSENTEPKSESASVLYKVEEMQSEQWAWKKAELNKLQIRSQATARQLPTKPIISIPHSSRLTEEDVWTPFVTSLWPKLPDGLLKAGKTSWSDRYSFGYKNPLGGKPIEINCQLVYRLDNFINTNQGIFANVTALGTLSTAAGQDPTLSVKGVFKGYSMIDPASGRVNGGEYRIEQQVMVQKPNLPVARTTTFQGVRYWRPKFDKEMKSNPASVPIPQATSKP